MRAEQAGKEEDLLKKLQKALENSKFVLAFPKTICYNTKALRMRADLPSVAKTTRLAAGKMPSEVKTK